MTGLGFSTTRSRFSHLRLFWFPFFIPRVSLHLSIHCSLSVCFMTGIGQGQAGQLHLIARGTARFAIPIHINTSISINLHPYRISLSLRMPDCHGLSAFLTLASVLCHDRCATSSRSTPSSSRSTTSRYRLISCPYLKFSFHHPPLAPYKHELVAAPLHFTPLLDWFPCSPSFQALFPFIPRLRPPLPRLHTPAPSQSLDPNASTTKSPETPP